MCQSHTLMTSSYHYKIQLPTSNVIARYIFDFQKLIIFFLKKKPKYAPINPGIKASNPPKLCDNEIPIKGIHILTANAVSQGFCDVKYPKIAAADKTIKTEIPVSSQFGWESIQAIDIPARVASKMTNNVAFFMVITFQLIY